MTMRNLLHNYILKNMAIFILLLVIAILSIIATSYRSVDGKRLRGQVAELQRINESVDEVIDRIIVAEFALVNIMSRTSYPDVALDYFMEQQFYDMAAEMKEGGQMDILLYDAEYNVRPSGSTSDDMLDELATIDKGLFLGDDNIHFTQHYVVYTKKLVRDKAVIGYLVGLRSKADISRIIRAEHAKRTSSIAVLRPSVRVEYPEYHDGHISLVFSHDEGAIHRIDTESLFIIAVVVLTVLFVFLILFRRSLLRPIREVERVIEYVGANKDEPYSGKMPKDTLFQKIAKMLLQMDQERRVHEDERRRQEVSRKMASAAAHVAHDMRSPISVLKAYVDLKPDDVEGEFRIAAQRSVDKMGIMADNLMDYARANQLDKRRAELRPFIKKEVVPEAVNGDKNKNALSVTIPENLNVIIDTHKFSRVLINIIRNAYEAISNKVGKISIYVAEGDDGELVLNIRDNGKGIKQNDLPIIFERYFTLGKKGGTGLGLAYCKQVVEAHGGTIEVESEEGKGTTFTIRIPNCVVEAVDSVALKNVPKIICENKRFIIVDDDADIRMRWREIVYGNGGAVAHEASSMEDIEARGDEIIYRDIDVAMVDYHYEGSKYTGADVIRHMRSKGVREVHLCSGFYDDDAVRAEAFSAGADSVIPKA